MQYSYHSNPLTCCTAYPVAGSVGSCSQTSGRGGDPPWTGHLSTTGPTGCTAPSFTVKQHARVISSTNSLSKQHNESNSCSGLKIPLIEHVKQICGETEGLTAPLGITAQNVLFRTGTLVFNTSAARRRKVPVAKELNKRWFWSGRKGRLVIWSQDGVRMWIIYTWRRGADFLI